MHKKNLLVLIVAFVFVVGFLFFITWQLKIDPVKLLSSYIPSMKKEATTFSEIQGDDLSREYDPNTKPTSFASKFQRELSEGKAVASSDKWSWDSSRIKARIVGGSDVKKTLLLSVEEPVSSGITDPVEVSIECTPEQTASFSASDLSYVKGNFALMDGLVGGEEIYTYCLNADCSSIGKECILIR